MIKCRCKDHYRQPGKSAPINRLFGSRLRPALACNNGCCKSRSVVRARHTSKSPASSTQCLIFSPSLDRFEFSHFIRYDHAHLFILVFKRSRISHCAVAFRGSDQKWQAQLMKSAPAHDWPTLAAPPFWRLIGSALASRNVGS